ncbi:hypothetical protein J1614_006644 [Plenodomus biglobosus]|nr:hypothetical protein J1614_006644 [Plenodomus biglobosus]
MLFGASDKKIEGNTRAWCIAKIMRLVGPIQHPTDSEAYKDEFELAEALELMDNPLEQARLIKRGHWRKELEDITDPPVSPNPLDIIETLLVLDPDKSHTAAQILTYLYLEASLDFAKAFQALVPHDHVVIGTNES